MQRKTSAYLYIVTLFLGYLLLAAFGESRYISIIIYSIFQPQIYATVTRHEQ